MQVARISRPKPRTLPNKVLETLQAVKLEALRSKDGILRLYLDHAPYGRNVVGVRAASLRYFGKDAERLSWAEAATLAVLPNQPGLVAPGVRTGLLKKKRDGLLRRLAARGRIPAETLELSLLEPAPDRSRPFDSTAPHLARWFRSDPLREGTVVRSTVRKDLQTLVQRLVAEHAAERLAPLGIRNAAALVVETGSGKVRAYAASQGFFDEEGRGQVDGLRAPRSPGSLLKPFLYAMAMDRGLLLPDTRLKDVPTAYGAFSPSNASETHDGLVRAKEALVRSLNVPAVRVLAALGVAPFHRLLGDAGVKTLFRAPEQYGLPLILGGAEVTAWDMAALYRGLGNGGRFGPLRREENAPEPPARSLLSPGACFLTLSMLRELRRPDSESYWQLYRDRRPIAWKTGTSYGLRDAWAAGVSPRWTLVVWAGNFEGEGNANLSGATCAGTLLFAIHNLLPEAEGPAWFEPPAEDLEPVTLCLETGYMAGPFCGRTQEAEAPRFMRPLAVCPYHRNVIVSTVTGLEVCSACWNQGRTRPENRLVVPPDVAQYLRESGSASNAPRHNPLCPLHRDESAVEILYPQTGARLFIPRDLDGRLEKVAFRVAHREEGCLVHWYLDHRYLGATRNIHRMACAVSKGAHTLDVVDENGNRASVSFRAELREGSGRAKASPP
jgi:penicillin-binding protein 1C